MLLYNHQRSNSPTVEANSRCWMVNHQDSCGTIKLHVNGNTHALFHCYFSQKGQNVIKILLKSLRTVRGG